MHGRLIWVSTPAYTIGLITSAGRVTDAPPIARWTLGRPEHTVADHYRRHGAHIIPIDPPETT